MLDGFWKAAAAAPFVILTDFDFTISNEDVGDLIAERLAPPSDETRRRFGRREIGTRGYWLDSMIRVEQAAAECLADQVGIDPGFVPFADWCAEQGIPLAVVSDGFSFYIDRILARHGVRPLPVFSNRFGGTGSLQFPHGNPYCDLCGCCKAGIVRRVKDSGAHILYLGDGVSDRYAVAFADWVFAKASLADRMREWGAPFFPLTDWGAVQRTVAAGLAQFRDGSHPGKAGLAADPICRF
ncbi:MAG TPA: MtnX-like HAD-IB family phosphatase [Symbiobacteriaceae bacterium]|nr:MtnX-like HAD-IB family phosphatase [Symbiobacteriaceae bacterium]